jgi:hypothetical protein
MSDIRNMPALLAAAPSSALAADDWRTCLAVQNMPKPARLGRSAAPASSNSIFSWVDSTASFPQLNRPALAAAQNKFTSGFHQQVLRDLGNAAAGIRPADPEKVMILNDYITSSNEYLTDLASPHQYQKGSRDQKAQEHLIELNNILRKLERLAGS